MQWSIIVEASRLWVTAVLLQIYTTFVLLMGRSSGLGTALLVQEHELRPGMAQTAEKFDLIIAAPGSRIDMMLAAVYLQPVDVPLLDGHDRQPLG